MADNHHRFAVEPCQATDYGMIIPEVAIPMQLVELGKDKLKVIKGKWAIDVASYLAVCQRLRLE